MLILGSFQFIIGYDNLCDRFESEGPKKFLLIQIW